jgi:DNA processing protein
MTVLTPELAAATLVCLPEMTHLRLRTLVDHFGGPIPALTAVHDRRAGDVLVRAPLRTTAEHITDVTRLWSSTVDAGAVARRLEQRGTRVSVETSHDYPISDPFADRPVVLLAEGLRPDALLGPKVAIVGTRAASPHGLADARELGAFLAGAGVTIVSGLAIGIDAAAHEGALDAGGLTIGVVATGLDVEYPRRHRVLYHRVREAGLVLGESGFGVRPDPWRFPVRNRIIAALADVVVVVEATITGGARITAQFALDYGRPVLSVPGSRRNPSAAGTNALIADGAHPLVDWSDVTIALGLAASASRQRATRPAPSAEGTALLRALSGEAATPDQLASRTGFAPDRVAVTLFELERAGWIDRTRGEIWPR